jgi:hypothetical protein
MLEALSSTPPPTPVLELGLLGIDLRGLSKQFYQEWTFELIMVNDLNGNILLKVGDIKSGTE